MKASFKGKYDNENIAGGGATVSFNAGELKLKATLTDAVLVNGPSFNGLSLALERPGFFVIDYNVPKNASFKGKYDNENVAGGGATVSFNAGELKLKASLTDAALVNGPSFNGLSLAVERPGFFVIDYNVPKNDFKFQFMNTVRVADKPLNLMYMHSRGDNRTMLDGTLVLDSANKLSANHVFGSKNCKLKYTYVHEGFTTFEPSYDYAKNAWDFALSRKVYGNDVVKASYQTLSKNLGLEWTRKSKLKNGSFKIAASVNMGEEKKVPKLTAETMWDFEM